MHTLLDAPPLSHHPNNATHFGDMHVEGPGLADTWTNTLRAIRWLAKGGLVLNTSKLQLMMRFLVVLGY